MCFSRHTLFLPKLLSLFVRTYKRHSSRSERYRPMKSSFSDGDTLLDYQFALFHNLNLGTKLFSVETGALGVAGDDPIEIASGTRATTSSKKRNMDTSALALHSLGESSSSLAASAANHARHAEIMSLSATSKTFRECDVARQPSAADNAQVEGVNSYPASGCTASTIDGVVEWSQRGSDREDGIAQRGGAVAGGARGSSGGMKRITVPERASRVGGQGTGDHCE